MRDWREGKKKKKIESVNRKSERINRKCSEYIFKRDMLEKKANIKRQRAALRQPEIKWSYFRWMADAWSAPGKRSKRKREKLLNTLGWGNSCTQCSLFLTSSFWETSQQYHGIFPPMNLLILVINKSQHSSLSYFPFTCSPDCLTLIHTLHDFIRLHIGQNTYFILHWWADGGISAIRGDQRVCWFMHLYQ